MLMLTTLFTPWCLKSFSFSSCWCKHFENGVLTWREAEKSSCGFLQMCQDPSEEGHSLLLPPQTAILLWRLQEELEEFLNLLSNALNKVMLTKTGLILILMDLLLTLLHQECPPFLTAPFTPLPPSCPSDLLDLVLSFWFGWRTSDMLWYFYMQHSYGKTPYGETQRKLVVTTDSSLFFL